MGSMLPYIAAPWILWEYLLGGAITIKKKQMVNGKDYLFI